MPELIHTQTVSQAFVSVLSRLTKKEEIRDVTLWVEDGSIPFVFAPPFNLDMPFEMQEAMDIISGEPCFNGMRYRYSKNPTQIGQAYAVDWQYSQDAHMQIETIKELLKSDPGSDKLTITFQRPERDLHAYKKRRRGGMQNLQQRIPCGLIWNYRKTRGGFRVLVLNRSIWPIKSMSSDFHLPGMIAYHLGHNVKEFNMTAMRFKQSRRGFPLEWLQQCVVFADEHLAQWKEITKYDTPQHHEWGHLEAACEAARGGDFKKAETEIKAIRSRTMYRDWAVIIVTAELLHQKKYASVLEKWGFKSAGVTKSRGHNSKAYKPDYFLVKYGWNKGVLFNLYASNFLKVCYSRGLMKAADRVMDKVLEDIRIGVLLQSHGGSAKAMERFKTMRKRHGFKLKDFKPVEVD